MRGTEHAFAIDADHFLLDGRAFQIRCGEIHAPRVPREYWRHRLQLARAMGLNTVCAYLFWNLHEPAEGHFTWTGQADAAEFCRIAQQEGLWVLLRPGPYACAEWEMGGLPWWLLKHDDIKLRTRDPRYLSCVRRYFEEVGRMLAPLQITRGGPILMVQVENEYGFFGSDAQYMSELRRMLLECGFNVPLFACNPAQHLGDGYCDGLFPVVNFGSDPASGFDALRRLLPRGPLMCGEFYPGWFDTWGAPHHRGNAERYFADLKYMLDAGSSFSLYMAHGGTSFGLWSGADRPFKPDTSSYDYDAPITEAGWTSEKFQQTRALLAQHLLPGERIPEPPAANPVMSFSAVRVTQCAMLMNQLEQLTDVIADARPGTMERYDQGFGCIVYRTTIPAGPEARLEAAAVHDFGLVFLNGQRLPAVLDRRSRHFALMVPPRGKPARLEIFVEAMGRVNFGVEVHDRKGLHAPLLLDRKELTGWEIYRLPLDAKMLSVARYEDGGADNSGPALWRSIVNIERPADTFLDLRSWGKGVAWMNGHCLGRFWNIGPTQTMYVPGPWLKPGENELVVFDLLGPANATLAGLEEPILSELRPELDFAAWHRPRRTLHLEGVRPVHEGEFAAGTRVQEIRLEQPVRARQFCVESLSALDGKPFAAIAELDLLDEAGGAMSHEGWTIAYVDSEERSSDDGSADNAIDGQTANYWHTAQSDGQPGHPHRLVLDLGSERLITGFRYVPRQGPPEVTGRIKNFRLYAGNLVTGE